MLDSLADLVASLRRRPDVSWVEARFVEDRREQLRLRNREVTSTTRARAVGVGIRVVVHDAWGFAATADISPAALERTGRAAIEVARAAAPVCRRRVQLADEAPVRARFRSPREIDPFEVPAERKVAVLLEPSERMLAGLPPGSSTTAGMDWVWVRKAFVSSSGARIEQDTLHGGASLSCLVRSDDGRPQRRSYPSYLDGDIAQGGFERIAAMGLADHADRLREEALALTKAPPCPSGTSDLILEGSQLALQIHESCGHATELDRILGTERSLAGGSFLQPQMLGSLRYGSDLVTIVADASVPGGIGTFGFDDEGVPARRQPLIERGILVGFQSSRETAAELGLGASSGAMRADGALRAPMIRMTNVSLEPGEGTLEDLVADTRDGILMATNRSWSIDDLRLNFQFGCEAAWEIKNGRRTRLLRDPVYAGVTPRFWQSCDAVTGRSEWRVWGIQNCGKGEPLQIMYVGHGASPSRFRGVSVGSGG